MSQDIDTAKAERRTLRFHDIDELLAEVDRIVESNRTAALRRTGNWTVGQTFGHLAAWINYGYDGFPMKPPPFFIRWILRRKLKQYLKSGMPSGIRIPGVKAGTYAVEVIPDEAAAETLRRALVRLNSDEPCPYESPAFGAMSHDDRIALNLRHAELHLGFLHP